MLNKVLLWFRPSRVLGLLLLVELICFVSFIFWSTIYQNKTLFSVATPIIQAQGWLFLIGAVSALSGWIVSSMVTIRNSIKQHTINTLLQTRLSETYMKRASVLNTSFFTANKIDAPYSLERLTTDATDEEKDAIGYILNYFEFIAVGIRHGDLDEKMLKETIRGILVNATKISHEFIISIRQEDGNGVAKYPRTLENLLWLKNRWK